MGIFDKFGSEGLEGQGSNAPFRHTIRLGNHRIALPQSRILRIVVGILFVLFGLVGFLPIVGFWMIPVGLFILSVDFAPVRRVRRRMTVWFQRKWNNRNGISDTGDTEKTPQNGARTSDQS